MFEIWESARLFVPGWVGFSVAALLALIGHFGTSSSVANVFGRKVKSPTRTVFYVVSIFCLFGGAFISLHNLRLEGKASERETVVALDQPVALDPTIRNRIVRNLRVFLKLTDIAIELHVATGNDGRMHVAREVERILKSAGGNVARPIEMTRTPGEDFERFAIELIANVEDIDPYASAILVALGHYVHADFRTNYEPGRKPGRITIRFGGNPGFLSDGTVILRH